MKKAFCLLLIFTICSVQSIQAQSEINRTLYFDLDQHALTKSSEASLLNLIKQLSECTESDIEIVGHTDQQGSLEYNMELSKKRAQEVQQFIVNAGYPSSEIKINFLGESNLLSSSMDKQSMQANRRVSIVAHTYNYSNIKDFVGHLRPDQTKKVIINNDRANEVNLTQGTIAKIPEDAFCNQDGSPLSDHKVEMIFKEAFDYAQMIDDRLFTQTADQLLETGGMVFMEATQDGKPVKLQEGKEIELLFPEQKSKGGMELFTGIEDEDGVTWEETGEKITEQKKELFLQVDLSPITNFKIESQDPVVLPGDRMPKYPKELRMPHPPAKFRYSDEKYKEVYAKYEEQLAAYHKYNKERPEKLKAWNADVNRRKGLLHQHKRDHIQKYVNDLVGFHIGKITKNQNEISHHKLVSALESVLKRKVGDAGYQYLNYRNELFMGSLEEVLENHHVAPYDYSVDLIGDYCPDIHKEIAKVKRSIMDRKIEMGYVDADASRYIVRTSNLGWINCDRFYNLDESQKMNFEFAMESKDNEYYLIFKDIKSLIRPTVVKGKIRFSGLPIGEEVRLVSIGVKDSGLYVASQDMKLGSQDRLNLNYKKAKLQDVRDVLSSI